MRQQNLYFWTRTLFSR